MIRVASGTQSFASRLSLLRNDQQEFLGSLNVTAFQFAYPIAQLKAGDFRFSRAPQGIRFELNTLDGHSFFFCSNQKGKSSLPIIGPMQQNCEKKASWALGFQLAHMQWDQWTKRFQGEWIGAQISWHPLSHGHSMQVLYQNIFLYSRLSYLSRSYGDLASSAGRQSSSTLGLTNGLQALIRSPNMRFQWDLDFSSRWVITGLPQQKMLKLGSSLTYNFLVSRWSLAKIGVLFELSYYDQAYNSFSPLASDTRSRSSQIGLLIGIEPFRTL